MQDTETKRFNLLEHFYALGQARDEAFSEGDWERVDFIQMCIDDTQARLTAIKNQQQG